jgi:hypothetical protein
MEVEIGDLGRKEKGRQGPEVGPITSAKTKLRVSLIRQTFDRDGSSFCFIILHNNAGLPPIFPIPT